MQRENRTVRITCRLTPEENAALKALAESRAFGGSVSRVIRNLLKLRLSVIREMMEERRPPKRDIGDEIAQMFRSYEDDGSDMSWPSDINQRI